MVPSGLDNSALVAGDIARCGSQANDQVAVIQAAALRDIPGRRAETNHRAARSPGRTPDSAADSDPVATQGPKTLVRCCLS